MEGNGRAGFCSWPPFPKTQIEFSPQKGFKGGTCLQGFFRVFFFSSFFLLCALVTWTEKLNGAFGPRRFNYYRTWDRFIPMGEPPQSACWTMINQIMNFHGEIWNVLFKFGGRLNGFVVDYDERNFEHQ